MPIFCNNYQFLGNIYLNQFLYSIYMHVEFICTGGTIDKDYASSAGTHNFDIGNPAFDRMLKSINLNFDYAINSILKKDSLDLTDEDRNLIYYACIKSKYEKIIISHGTDTMIKTANRLSAIKNKVIILFGAAKPEKFYDSDARFNLGVAIGAINLLDNGLYIAMNGRVYNWDKCEKRTADGMFIEKISELSFCDSL